MGPAMRERGEVMSREQKVAVVEAYLDCFVTKDLSKVSFAEHVTFEGPRMPKLTGRATILGFLTQILPVVRSIQLKQHIVEGDYVATIFDMVTVNGVDHVFDRIHIVNGQIRAIHALYYPEQPPEVPCFDRSSADRFCSSRIAIQFSGRAAERLPGARQRRPFGNGPVIRCEFEVPRSGILR
jgi:hypothetical protein